MEDIRVYDFKKSEKFSVENIRILTLMCEEFCKTSNLQMGYELKNEALHLEIIKTEQSTYENILEKINHDSIIIEYDRNPLIKNLTMFLDKRVALIIVDMILGGDGRITDCNRNLTKIDLEMIYYLLENLLTRVQMPSGCEEIEIQDIYTDTAQYRKLKGKDSLFMATINVSLYGEDTGHMRVLIPYRSMETVINQLAYNKMQKTDNIEDDCECDIYSSPAFEHIKEVNLDISAILGSTSIKISELLKLEDGDILLLDQKINDDIDVNVGGYKSYRAKPGLVGVRKGIEITDILDGER